MQQKRRGLLDDPVPTKSDLVGLLDNPVARRALGYALPWFLNTANTPTGVARAGVDVARALPGAVQKMTQDGYAGVVGHMTGEVPLVTGEPGRPHTDADTRRGTEHAVNAAATAGLASVAAPARAAALGARTRPAAAIKAYHGTDASFDKFDPSRSLTGGISVAPEKSLAQQFGSNVKELSIAPGKYFDFKDPEDVRKAAQDLKGTLSEAELKSGEYVWMESPEFQDWLRKNNYDGTWFRENYDADGTALLVTKQGKVADAATGNTLFSSTKQASPASIFMGYDDDRVGLLDITSYGGGP